MKAIEFIENEIGNAHDNPNLDNEMLAELFDKYAEAKSGQVNEVVNGMAGEVIKMGTMFIDDEHLTGVFVMCAPDEFTRQTTNILYRNVKITPVNE